MIYLTSDVSLFRPDYLEALMDFRLIDDDFMTIALEDKDCLELILSLILHRHISIKKFFNQRVLKNLYGRDVKMDILAITDDNRYINIEVQRSNFGAHFKRARYHQSLIDASITVTNEQWQDIPSVCVIFFTEHDYLRKGLSLYHINRTLEETGEHIQDETQLIYVNASIQDDTPIGRLVHDFMCRDYHDMYYEVLRNRVRYFKESEGDKLKMCKIMDDIRRKGEEEGWKKGVHDGEIKTKINIALKLMAKQNITFEEAMNLLDVCEDEQQIYRKMIFSS